MADFVETMLTAVKAQLDANKPWTTEVIPVVVEKEGDTAQDLAARLAKLKLGVVLSCFEFQAAGPNAVECIVTATVTENPKLNRPGGGTTARMLAMELAALLHGWPPSAEWGLMYRRGGQRVTPAEGTIGWEVRFGVKTGLKYNPAA
jgi:hypothetical protein